MWPGLSVATHHERIDWHTAGIVLRQEAQLAAVLLGNTDEALAHLGAGAGKVAKCRDGLRVQSNALAAELVQWLVTNDQPGELEERGERTKLGYTCHAPFRCCWPGNRHR